MRVNSDSIKNLTKDKGAFRICVYTIQSPHDHDVYNNNYIMDGIDPYARWTGN